MEEHVTSVERSAGVARDFDLRPDGSWVGVFERDGSLHVRDSHGADFPVRQSVRFPIVRAVGYDRVLIVDSRPMRSTPGGYLLTLDGEVVCTFSVGDGVQDVVTLDDLVAVSYFDEGVFSGLKPSEEGIAFFELDGQLFAGYQSMFGSEAVNIADCYAVSRLNRHGLVFSAYTGFELVRVYPRKGRQDVVSVPRDLHGASAISVCGDTACFFGPYQQKNALFTWRPGARPEQAGRHSGTLRGIGPEHFLSIGEHGYTLVTWAG